MPLSWLPIRNAFSLTPRRMRWLVLLAAAAVAAVYGVRGPLLREWRLREAREALQGGDPRRASTVLLLAEAAHPADAEVQYLLGRAKRRSDQVPEATSHLQNAEKLGYPAEPIRQQRLLMLVQTGRHREVQRDLDRLLRQGVSDELADEIYEAQAKGFLASFRLPDALVCLNFWLEWRPGRRQARLWRADLYERLEQWEEAREDYAALLALSPADAEARLHLAEVLLRLNRTAEGLAEFDAVLTATPANLAARLGRARCLQRLGKPAQREFLALLDEPLTNARRAEVLVELGQLSLFEGRPEEAIQRLSEAARLDPLNRDVFYPLSQASSRLNREAPAREYARRHEELTAAHDALHELLQRVLTHPDDAEARIEAGKVLIKIGRPDEAAAWLQTALLYDPTHQSAHQLLARYYRETGNSDRERYHLRLAGASDRKPEVAPKSQAEQN